MSTDAEHASGLRFGTLNTWGIRGDWPTRRARMAEGVRSMAPDVFTFQETVVTAEYDQMQELLGSGFHIVHSKDREPDGQGISTASRWPIGQVEEVDLHLTERTGDFACTALITEILAPQPLGRLWVVNHFPDYQLDHERERQLQAVAVANAVHRLHAERPGHIIIAGDLDAAPESTSIRFFTGLQSLNDQSVCFRDAWASAHPADPGPTYIPENPFAQSWDWPYRRIDYILVGCEDRGGPTLVIDRCDRTFDGPLTTASDHYGLVADLTLP